MLRSSSTPCTSFLRSFMSKAVPQPTQAHAFVSLGANLPSGSGSPSDTLRMVLPELARLSAQALLVSAFYESDPKDCPPDSPQYINAVAALLPSPDDDPFTLLEKLQRLESSHGRVRSGLRNEARTLDLDLLSFGGLQCATPLLILPHPRAHQRRFVLEPWIEIAGGDWPLNGKTLNEWLQENGDPPLRTLPS